MLFYKIYPHSSVAFADAAVERVAVVWLLSKRMLRQESNCIIWYRTLRGYTLYRILGHISFQRVSAFPSTHQRGMCSLPSQAESEVFFSLIKMTEMDRRISHPCFFELIKLLDGGRRGSTGEFNFEFSGESNRSCNKVKHHPLHCLSAKMNNVGAPRRARG